MWTLPPAVLDRLYREREDDEESIQRFIKVQPLKGVATALQHYG